MNNKQYTILFLSSWYPNRVLPTLGNFVQKHAEAVALNSNVVALFAYPDTDCKQKFEIVEETINNVYTVNVYYKKVQSKIPVISSIQKVSRYYDAYVKGLKLINERFPKIDILHHNILYPVGIVAWYLKKKKKIPYIISEHWTGYLPSKDTKANWFQKNISKIIARNAGYITPVSYNLKEAMLHYGLKSNFEVVYNVVDTKLFFPKPNKQNSGKIKFLHVSTLNDAHKNISGMLRVVAKLAKERNDFEFWFIGDGDTTPHIAYAKKMGIYNNFTFFDGTKTTHQVADLMRNSDCFVLFSNYENLPCVITEALASGIPVISSAVGGIPEHINDNFGILVKPADEDLLLQSLKKMIDNIKSGKYNSSEMSSYAKNNFSYQKISERFHQLYQRLLTSHA